MDEWTILHWLLASMIGIITGGVVVGVVGTAVLRYQAVMKAVEIVDRSWRRD